MKKEIVWPRGCQSAAMICVMLDAEFIWLSMDAVICAFAASSFTVSPLALR